MTSERTDPARGLFAISVTAELTGVNPQTLRGYENKGLLEPMRTEGGTRRYSNQDIERINEISALIKAGVNLAGISRVLDLQAETHRLRKKVSRLQERDSS